MILESGKCYDVQIDRLGEHSSITEERNLMPTGNTGRPAGHSKHDLNITEVLSSVENPSKVL